MKKLCLFAILFCCTLPAMATITTEEQFSDEYILNHGYSEEMSRLMNLSHSQIIGEKIPVSEYVHIYRPWQNGIRKFLMYLDPGLDDEQFGNHQIKYTVRWDSL